MHSTSCMPTSTDFDPTKYELRKNGLPVMDRWVLSKLNSLVKTVRGYLDEYRITECARELGSFVDELSNWYVRRCRERYWGSDMAQDKIDAYMTLYTVLETMSRLIAPFTPVYGGEHLSECGLYAG